MLILASKSATRKTLLLQAGLSVEAMGADIDERALEAGAQLSPPLTAQRLAEAKALAVSTRRPGTTVIGADQVLDSDGRLLHKPESIEAARTQLDRLAGRTHALHSGIALARNGTILWSGVETATLTMRAFSSAERDQVLALEGPDIVTSVGAYRLEGPSIRLFAAIEGDYFTILGLPLLPLLAALRRFAPDLIGE
jgi:septum formation protein